MASIDSSSCCGSEADDGRHTLVLDMDETLLHSSFEWSAADYVMPITVDGEGHTVYVRKRPHVEYFLRKVSEMFNVIVWTASVKGYAEPVIRKLLQDARVATPINVMYRTECDLVSDIFIKDLSRLGVPLEKVFIVDNSPAVALRQPKNLIPISSWFSDVTDAALLDLLPFLERIQSSCSIFDVLSRATAVRSLQIDTGEL
eukprot:TRINITY_DN31568_c0_g1_i1.p1 TRINITY_DN31568_c0_g1~~TRINITY_DN31568_c0_g1_i1.p1  ORF type:complete len:201 (+),score=36.91 TRINITY_DN31568_c0_g1_i1:46-648(+)